MLFCYLVLLVLNAFLRGAELLDPMNSAGGDDRVDAFLLAGLAGGLLLHGPFDRFFHCLRREEAIDPLVVVRRRGRLPAIVVLIAERGTTLEAISFARRGTEYIRRRRSNCEAAC